MDTSARTTTATFPRYLGRRVLADSSALHWPLLYARRYQYPRLMDRFLVPATAEPLISCGLTGTAEFREREPGSEWITRHIGPGDSFVIFNPARLKVHAMQKEMPKRYWHNLPEAELIPDLLRQAPGRVATMLARSQAQRSSREK